MSDRGKSMMVKLAACKELVVFDLETTGTDPGKYAEICEIGAIRVNFETGKVRKFSEQIKPRNGRMPKSATEVNHITTEELADKPYFEDVLPAFYNFVDGKVLLAHNSTFDTKFLKAYFPMVGKVYSHECLDSLAIDRELHKDRGKHDLATICNSYGLVQNNAHRAYDDAEMTARCVWKMRKEILDNMIIDLPEFTSSRVPYADTSYLRMKSFNAYKYADKKLGIAIFFNTNFGTFYYNVTRKVWGMQRMFIDMNVDIPAAAAKIRAFLGKTDEQMIDLVPAEMLVEKPVRRQKTA